MKKKETIDCMACSRGATFFMGTDRAPLCSTHRSVLRRRIGVEPWQETPRMSRREIRAALGFLILDA